MGRSRSSVFVLLAAVLAVALVGLSTVAVAAGKPPKKGQEAEVELTEEEAWEAQEAYEIAEMHKQEGYRFLNDVFIRPDIIKLKTGLLFEKMKTSDDIFAKSPRAKDFCTVNYIGYFKNGTEFERSNEPKNRKPEQLIPGWKQAMMLMAEGDRWKLYLSYNLAFGENGVPSKGIPPFAALVYELELVACPEAKRTIADARQALQEALLPPEKDPTSDKFVLDEKQQKLQQEAEAKRQIEADRVALLRQNRAAKAALKQQPADGAAAASSEQPTGEHQSETDAVHDAAPAEPAPTKKVAKDKPKKKSDAKVGFAKRRKNEDDDEL